MARIGHRFENLMGELNRRRHQFFGLAAGVAEQDTLIARAFVLIARGIDALRDIDRLLVDQAFDLGMLPVEAFLLIADQLDALARRLDARKVTTACLHPGVVATAIGDRAGVIAGFGWRLIKPFLISPEKGAATSLFLATVADPAPYHGAYVMDQRIAEPDTAARDDRPAEALWVESARLVGLSASAPAGA